MTPEFAAEVVYVLSELIEVGEEFVILYEDGLNVSSEELKQNTHLVETQQVIERAKKVIAALRRQQ